MLAGSLTGKIVCENWKDSGGKGDWLDVADFGWQAAPWLFSLAIVHQAELTALAAERLARIKQQRAAEKAVPV